MKTRGALSPSPVGTASAGAGHPADDPPHFRRGGAAVTMARISVATRRGGCFQGFTGRSAGTGFHRATGRWLSAPSPGTRWRCRDRPPRAPSAVADRRSAYRGCSSRRRRPADRAPCRGPSPVAPARQRRVVLSSFPAADAPRPAGEGWQRENKAARQAARQPALFFGPSPQVRPLDDRHRPGTAPGTHYRLRRVFVSGEDPSYLRKVRQPRPGGEARLVRWTRCRGRWRQKPGGFRALAPG